jgi:D-lactate dehydrogenase (cytochrome)
MTATAMSELVGRLAGIVGASHVLTAPEERDACSTDAFWVGERPLCVVAPGSVDEVARVVRAAAAAGAPVVSRGGGMSYTAGYVPRSEQAVTLDLRRLDRILEVDEADLTVTVEAGCTWKSLDDALRARGLRTPYFGPLSGLRATVGGTLSNDSMFLGSGLHGFASDNVLSLRVALADGRLLTTGSRANRGGRPFHRQFGPDLTGLFLADAGALGVKVEASLRLVRRPQHVDFASFAFDDFETLFAAQAEIARAGVAAECFAFDPFLNRNMAEPTSLGQAVDAVRDVVRSGKTVAAGMRDAARLAWAGRGFLSGVAWSLHVVVEGEAAPVASSRLASVRSIALSGGREIDPSLPRLIRAQPFHPVGEFLLGKRGERWVPIHACLPLSQVVRAWRETEAYFARRREVLDRFSIQTSYLTAVARAAVVLEPAFYYPDAPLPFHLRELPPGERSTRGAQPAVPGATEAVQGLLHDLAALYRDLGAVHQQVGKFYPWAEALDPTTLAVLRDLKQRLDPRGVLNPGALGL